MAVSENESVATKKPKLTAYVEEGVDKAIDREAAKERRSRSQMVALLIEEALKARGYEFPTDSSLESQDE
ncbi:ribbon-helix-helix protein, CopG family [Phormidesmis priestleyi ULC007]|uniref:Ribbon-helix-helix protein, CopG family n=1 Tax=Phormidesmis priestleyi ULC007 TaxID=1920490 RepID=A0A2T1DAK1_9CYAN|nr:ribbon-helix-helix protein, CopG family [Phormidesmis priestleyi]PSB17532.1 ribbon-helix-helix protein, CopG family [Phormidesmis priestleyi ULC007]PZO45519.1 MAG: ribbon-helix-helix protein, CopG family [Phormidesmis priestleyi]